MVAVDRYGFEMSASTGEGPRPIRIAFPESVSTPREVRAAMVKVSFQRAYRDLVGGNEALFGALPEDHQGQVIEIHPLASNSEGFVDPNAGIQQ